MTTHPLGYGTETTEPVYSFTDYFSQGSQGGDMIVVLRCENCPDGVDVALEAVDRGTDPPIHIPRTTVHNRIHNGVPVFAVMQAVAIPANWSSAVTITVWTNGTTPLPGTRIGVQMAVAVNSTVGALNRVEVAAVGSGSSFSLAGFAWEDRSSSVIDQLVVPHDVAIQHVPVSGVDTEVLRLTGAPKQVGAGSGADLTFDVQVGGAPAADTIFSLVSRSVPVGCEIWFKSVAGPVEFSVAPSKVSQENEFSVATDADLPEGYAGTVRAFLLLNGNLLPPDWSLQLMAIQPPPTTLQERPAQAGNGGPIKAKLLGSVTAKR